MADYTAVIVGVALAFIIILVLLSRMIAIVQPGQIGLVFVLGIYRRMILPGFNMVAPLSFVQKITPGSGPNRALGMLGVAESDLAPDLPLGVVRIGEMQVRARSVLPIPTGASVRVIQDSTVGIVLVVEEKNYPGKQQLPKPFTPVAPLR